MQTQLMSIRLKKFQPLEGAWTWDKNNINNPGHYPREPWRKLISHGKGEKGQGSFLIQSVLQTKCTQER